MRTQNEMILEHLKQGKKITPLEALNLFGCFRLGARIFEIKEMGYNIKSELTTNNGKTYSAYWIESVYDPSGHMVLV